MKLEWLQTPKGKWKPHIYCPSCRKAIDVSEIIGPEGYKVLNGDFGYAVIVGDTLWIPAVMGDMKEALKELHQRTGITKMVFSAILNPEQFKKHLKNIVREFKEWSPEYEEYVDCIEIKYEPELHTNTKEKR